MSDSINPAHYRSHPSGIECIQVTEHMSFTLGSVIKYVWRADLKHDDGGIEDLKKAAWYIARELERRQNAQNTPTPATTPEPDTRPAEPPQNAAEGGLRVGARVRIKKGAQTGAFVISKVGKKGTIARPSSDEPTDWIVSLDRHPGRYGFYTDELEVIA